MTSATSTSPADTSINPFQVAAGMLHNDARFVVPLLGVLSISAILDGLFLTRSFDNLASLLILDRALQLLVIVAISVRWAKRFERQPRASTTHLATAQRTLIFGFGIWSILTLPTFLAAFARNDAVRLLLIASTCAGLFWALRYYFFFATSALLGGNLARSARSALFISQRDPRAAVRSLMAPFGLTALITSLLLAPYPDGRSLVVNVLASSAEGFFWIISTYTALAFALILVDDHEWRRAGLEPYRTEQLQTLQTQGSGRLSTLLTPSAGVKMLLLAILVFIGNLARDLSIPPAAHIAVKKVQVDDYVIRVEISVSDPQYQLRGFKSSTFRVGSKSGDDISQVLSSSSRDAEKPELPHTLPLTTEPVTLYLEFRSNKTKDALKKIDYAWLWYQLTPIVPLPLNTAEDIPTSAITESASANP